jgi:hypothetical protein
MTIQRSLGPNGLEVAKAIGFLVQPLLEQKKLAEAEKLSERELAIHEKSLPPDHHLIALSLRNMAILRWTQGKLTEAEDLLRQALAIQEAAFAPTNQEVIMTLELLIELYEDQGDVGQAKIVQERLEEIRMME